MLRKSGNYPRRSKPMTEETYLSELEDDDLPSYGSKLSRAIFALEKAREAGTLDVALSDTNITRELTPKIQGVYERIFRKVNGVAAKRNELRISAGPRVARTGAAPAHHHLAWSSLLVEVAMTLKRAFTSCLLALTLVLNGCGLLPVTSSVLVHPTKPSIIVDLEQASCMLASWDTHPYKEGWVSAQDGYFYDGQNARVDCATTKHTTSCSVTPARPGGWSPPNTIKGDENAIRRSVEFDNCLKAQDHLYKCLKGDVEIKLSNCGHKNSNARQAVIGLIKISGDEQGTIYALPSTLRKVGDGASIVILFDLRTPRKASDDKKAIRSEGVLLELECRKREIRIRTSIGYSNNMGEGEYLSYFRGVPAGEHFGPIVPGTFLEDLQNFACKG